MDGRLGIPGIPGIPGNQEVGQGSSNWSRRSAAASAWQSASEGSADQASAEARAGRVANLSQTSKRRRSNEEPASLPSEGSADQASAAAMAERVAKLRQRGTPGSATAEEVMVDILDQSMTGGNPGGANVPAQVKQETGAAVVTNWNLSVGVAAAVPASLGHTTGVGQPFAKVKQEYLVPQGAHLLTEMLFSGLCPQNSTQSPVAVPASLGHTTGFGQLFAGPAQCQLRHPVGISKAAAVTGQGPAQANGAQNVVIESSSGTYKGAVNQFGNPDGFGTFYYSLEKLTDKNVDIVYQGYWQNGLRHGKGTLINKNGETYKGYWKNNKRHGEGTITSNVPNNKYVFTGKFVDDKKNGEGKEVGYYTYDGMWKNDKRHGKGTITDNEGNVVFDGEFVDGKRDGKGKDFCSISGETYEGDWVKNERHGKGILTRNGVVYDGEFENNSKHGTGKQTCPNGYFPDIPKRHHVYEGQFEDGLRHGEGILTLDGNEYYVKFETGRMILRVKLVHKHKEIELPEGKYIGAVNQEDEPHGEGTLIYKKGDKKGRVAYVGGFVNGKRQGDGEIRWKDGQFYKGNFKNDQINGRGKDTRPGGYCYDGNFLNGEPEGHGTLTFPHGSKILYQVGQFKNGTAHGEGTIIFADGSSFKGAFKNGYEDGKGTLTYPSGDAERKTYVGHWQNGERHGLGTLTMKDGSALQINYNNGVMCGK